VLQCAQVGEKSHPETQNTYISIPVLTGTYHNASASHKVSLWCLTQHLPLTSFSTTISH
jgi:hypothetical protein